MQKWLNPHRIMEVMRNKGYRVFENPAGYDLNMVGIRTASMKANRFDDWITVFYIFNQNWNFFAFPATTDPGTFYRQNPVNVKGTAVLKPGQYRRAYKIGRHKNYKALQQQNPVTAYRDANRDEILDTSNMIEETGMFGINIHHANAFRPSTVVGKWSAGCQVFQDSNHFSFLLALCEKGREKFGNSFTYTLLIEHDFIPSCTSAIVKSCAGHNAMASSTMVTARKVAISGREQ